MLESDEFVGIQMRLPVVGLEQPRLPKYARGAQVRARFVAFHELNPHVYRALVYLTRWLRDEYKLKKFSLWLPYNWLRWGFFIQTRGEETYKLNNSFVPHYSRLIMQQESDLAEFFDTRAMKY